MAQKATAKKATAKRAQQGTKAVGGKSSTESKIRVTPVKRPPGGVIAGSNNADALIGYLSQSMSYLMIGDVKILRNPDPLVQEQFGALMTKGYDEMFDKDAHVAGVIDTRINATVGLPREIQPGCDDPEAERIAEVIRTVFERWECYDEDCEALMYGILAGYRPAEIEYTVWDDGLVGILKLHDRDPDGFVFSDEWEMRMRTVGSPFAGKELPPRKFVCLQFRARANNPYGVGLGRTLWWMHWMKRVGLRSWMVALEKYGVPTMWFKHAPGLPKNKRDALVAAGNKVQTDTVLATSNDVEIELLEAKRGAGSSHEDHCQYMDEQISKRVLGHTMTSDAKQVGLGGQQGGNAGKVRQDILERDARMLAELITRTVIRWLVDFNFGPQADNLYPRLFINAAPAEDLKALADRDVQFVKDLGLPIATKYFYETYSIPTPEDGEELVNDSMVEQAQAQMPAGLDPMGGGFDENGEPLPPKDKGAPGKKKAAGAKKAAAGADGY